MSQNIIETLLVNNAKKAMLDGVDSLDENTLKKELKKHLSEQFEAEDRLKEIRELIEKELENINVKETILATDICLKVKEILDKENSYGKVFNK